MLGVIEGRFYTTEAAAHYLGLGYSDVMRRIAIGEIEAISISPHRPRSPKLILAASLEAHPHFKKRPRRR